MDRSLDGTFKSHDEGMGSFTLLGAGGEADHSAVRAIMEEYEETGELDSSHSRILPLPRGIMPVRTSDYYFTVPTDNVL
jgi:hypothetical protein